MTVAKIIAQEIIVVKIITVAMIQKIIMAIATKTAAVTANMVATKKFFAEN